MEPGIPDIHDIQGYAKFQRVIQIKHNNKKKNVLLPLMHCLYFNQSGPDESPGYGICCLEPGIFAWGSTLTEAQDAIVFFVQQYFKQRLENDLIDAIDKDFASDSMEPYWSLYRQIMLRQAIHSGEIAPENKIVQDLLKKIKSLEEQNKDVKSLSLYLDNVLEENRRLHAEMDAKEDKYIGIYDLLPPQQEKKFYASAR